MLTKQVKLKHTASPSPAPKKKSRIAALFFLERFRALRKQSCGMFSAKSDEPFCDGSVCNAQPRQTSSIFSRTDQSRFGGSFFKNNDIFYDFIL